MGPIASSPPRPRGRLPSPGRATSITARCKPLVPPPREPVRWSELPRERHARGDDALHLVGQPLLLAGLSPVARIRETRAASGPRPFTRSCRSLLIRLLFVHPGLLARIPSALRSSGPQRGDLAFPSTKKKSPVTCNPRGHRATVPVALLPRRVARLFGGSRRGHVGAHERALQGATRLGGSRALDRCLFGARRGDPPLSSGVARRSRRRRRRAPRDVRPRIPADGHAPLSRADCVVALRDRPQRRALRKNAPHN